MQLKSNTDFPIILGRRRIYVFPTAYGFVFVAVLLAMLFGSINYNNNLGFLLVFLLGGMVLVSVFHTFRNLLALHFISATADPVFAGDDAVFKIFVKAGHHSRRALSFGLEKHQNVIMGVLAGKDFTVEVKVPANDRGVLQPKKLTVSTRYPLGLFKAWSVLKPDLECLVYPKPVAGLPPTSERGGDLKGETDREEQLARSGVDDFAGLKPYQPGDPVRHIAWKTLSRGQGVFTKEFSRPTVRSVFLDYESLGDGDVESRLSRLAYSVLQAAGMNIEYGLVLPGKIVEPGRSAEHMHQCLKELALFGDEA